MKLPRILIAIVMVCLTSSSFASHRGEYTHEQMSLVNKLFELCPKEASQLLTQPHTRLRSGQFFGGETPEGISTNYTFSFVATYPAPSFATEAWQLVASEVITNRSEDGPQAPDRPNRHVEVTCEIRGQAIPTTCTADYNQWGHSSACTCPGDSNYNERNGQCE